MSEAFSGFVDVGELSVESSDGVLPPPPPTPLLYDRRGAERRALGLVPEPLERKGCSDSTSVTPSDYPPSHRVHRAACPPDAESPDLRGDRPVR